jgi:hypothetical protein
MNKKKLKLFLVISSFFLSHLCCNEKKDLSQIINSHVHTQIECSEEFSFLKEGILKNWNALIETGILEIEGADADLRPSFVTIQAIVEHVLSLEIKKEITNVNGIILAPMPATPLCTKGEISKELVDPTIENDPSRLFTVKARPTIIRDYLFKGGDLYIVYPKDGLKKRTEEQQKIYQQELVNYPTHLFDAPLNCDNIPTELIGATYFFKSNSGATFVFAIQMTQAKDPKEIGNFGLWFGSIDHPSLQERINALSSYLNQNNFDIFRKVINPTL